MYHKLNEVIADELGFENEYDLLESSTFKAVIPGICINCETVTESCEPDATQIYCDECGKPKVKSCLVLAGLI